MASQHQAASIGDGQRPLTDPSPSTKLANLEAFSDEVADPSDLAAEVEKLQGELTQMQETQAQNTRLGSVAAGAQWAQLGPQRRGCHSTSSGRGVGRATLGLRRPGKVGFR